MFQWTIVSMFLFAAISLNHASKIDGPIDIAVVIPAFISDRHEQLYEHLDKNFELGEGKVKMGVSHCTQFLRLTTDMNAIRQFLNIPSFRVPGQHEAAEHVTKEILTKKDPKRAWALVWLVDDSLHEKHSPNRLEKELNLLRKGGVRIYVIVGIDNKDIVREIRKFFNKTEIFIPKKNLTVQWRFDSADLGKVKKAIRNGICDDLWPWNDCAHSCGEMIGRQGNASQDWLNSSCVKEKPCEDCSTRPTFDQENEITTQGENSDKEPPWLLIGLAAGGGLIMVIIVVLILIVVCVKKRRAKKKTTEDTFSRSLRPDQKPTRYTEGNTLLGSAILN